MKKEYWLGIQREILQGRGILIIYLFFFFLVHIIQMTDIPLFAYSPRLVLEVIGLVSLIMVWFMGKSERTKGQSREIIIYMALLLLALAATLLDITGQPPLIPFIASFFQR